MPPDVQWHMIGHLQSNKCKKVLEIPNLFCIESVDSPKLALKLNKLCIDRGCVQRIFIEVYITTEDSITIISHTSAR